MNKTSKVAFLIASVIILITFIPRFIDIRYELPYYSIDENDIVEMAVGFMGGDIDYRLYKYGPLTSYLLAAIYYGIYAVERLFSKISFQSFIQRIFFEKRTPFYFIARLLNVVFNLLFILLVFKFCIHFFDSWTVWLATCLASLPLGDLLADFHIRIDTLQALCAFAAFYFIMLYYDQSLRSPSPRKGKPAATIPSIAKSCKPETRNKKPKKANPSCDSLVGKAKISTGERKNQNEKTNPKEGKVIKNLVLAGLFTGFGIAAKPMPGLIIIPVILFIFFLARRKFTFSSFLLLISFLFIGNFIGNPYSILNISKFINYNLTSIAGEAKRSFQAGYDITRFFGSLGLPLTLVGFACLIIGIFQKKDKILRLTCIFPILYFGVFAPFPARDYFYIALIPFLTIATARLIVLGSEKYLKNTCHTKCLVMITIAIILAINPLHNSIAKSIYYRSYDEYCCTAAEKWIRQNIHKGSNILLYGFYTNLPFLIDSDIRRHANLAEYFMYHRQENEWWVDQYIKSFENKTKSGCITYHIWKIRKDYQTHQEMADFLKYCKSNKIQYVVLNSSEHQSWERQARLEAAFNEKNAYRGGNVRIYKVLY